MTVAIVTLAVLSLTLGIALALVTRRCLSLGDERNAATMLMDQHRRLAEDMTGERDAAMLDAAKWRGERDAAMDTLAATREALTKERAESARLTKEKIDATSDDDLVDLSRGVFGSDLPSPGSGSAPAA